jgi:leucyl-tRNA synthetase
MHLKSYIENMEKYNIRSAFVSIFYEVLNDLRRCETRGGRTGLAIGKVMKDWLIALSPAIPHTAEEYWHRHIGESFVSIQQLNRQPELSIDTVVIEEDSYVQKLISDIRSIMAITKITPKTVQVYTAGKETAELARILTDGDYGKVDKAHRFMIQDFTRNRKSISLNGVDEYSAIEANRSFIESILSAKMEVRRVDDPVNGKIAWPGRPVIVLNK